MRGREGEERDDGREEVIQDCLGRGVFMEKGRDGGKSFLAAYLG